MRRTLRRFDCIFIFLLLFFISKAQQPDCILKPPQYTITFGSSAAGNLNSTPLSQYQQVGGSCPTDGHYSFVSHTSGCFSDDWHSLPEDHTPGDNAGNMLLVNAAPNGGVFLNTPVAGLKPNTTYELSLWLINLCKPTKKCPFVLLPSLSIELESAERKVIGNIVVRDLPRVEEPRWTQYQGYFTTPSVSSVLTLIMSDIAPGGCGNDFALDDIAFRECVKKEIKPAAVQKTKPATKQPAPSKPVAKKTTNPQQKKVHESPMIMPRSDTILRSTPMTKTPQKIFPSPPLVLRTRENALVRKIETEAGEIKINIYDNGEIDGDTVSIYHNNTLIRSHMGLSEKPITINLSINASEPHHEITMVADNLGSIPPNTSIMIITTATERYEVFISSSEQKNAKVVFDLKN